MNPPEGCSLNAAVAFELRTIRDRKGISIKEFARESGIGARSMSLYLNGRRAITVDQLDTMCRVLEIHSTELVRWAIEHMEQPHDTTRPAAQETSTNGAGDDVHLAEARLR
jgi:transcriptional regulator with XRE-family HTH domain